MALLITVVIYIVRGTDTREEATTSEPSQSEVDPVLAPYRTGLDKLAEAVKRDPKTDATIQRTDFEGHWPLPFNEAVASCQTGAGKEPVTTVTIGEQTLFFSTRGRSFRPLGMDMYKTIAEVYPGVTDSEEAQALLAELAEIRSRDCPTLPRVVTTKTSKPGLTPVPHGITTVLGRWCDLMVPGSRKFWRVMTLGIDGDGDRAMFTQLYDGSSQRLQLRDLGAGAMAVVGSGSGDKYMIDASGPLQLLDSDGYIRTARRLENTPQAGECGE